MPGKPEQSNYQVIARRFRPQSFRDVVGQDACVTTLKNAIRHARLAHAYLISGPRGTGKTTLARLFAKALNCLNPGEDQEPCNECASCREIAQGISIDVLEIDGASNRGIEDVRKINDTVNYASSSGKYKVYIIDEVHMLTKEAFNALLKTLEEPPEKVLFLFATTEPHKVLPTILSRCQRFHLKSLSREQIEHKLQVIAQKLERNVSPSVLRLVSLRAQGGLRDAESLFDQLLAFHTGDLDEAIAASLLGTLPEETFFRFDQAGKDGNFAEAFAIAETLFSEGKDIPHFIQTLIEHFRTHLVIKLAGPETPLADISPESRKKYIHSTAFYRKEQLLNILDLCLKTESKIKDAPSARIALEALLLSILRTFQMIPIDLLVKKLFELEQKVSGGTPAQPVAPAPTPAPAPVKPVTASSLTVDPSPALHELPKKPKPEAKPQPIAAPEAAPLNKATQARFDTLVQFAAVELEGKLIKK